MTQAMALDDSADWPLDAQLAILRLSITEPSFSADDLRKVIRPAPHPNMIGAAFSALRSQGLIETAGYTTSNAPSRHHGVLRTWKRKQEGVDAA